MSDTGAISIDTYNAMRAKNMTEQQLQSAVTGMAQRLGFLVYHTHDSRRSQPGYPDLHLIHPTRGISLFRELKTQTGRLRPAQQDWLAALTAAGHNASVWRPIDWFTNRIDHELIALPTLTERPDR